MSRSPDKREKPIGSTPTPPPREKTEQLIYKYTVTEPATFIEYARDMGYSIVETIGCIKIVGRHRDAVYMVDGSRIRQVSVVDLVEKDDEEHAILENPISGFVCGKEPKICYRYICEERARRAVTIQELLVAKPEQLDDLLGFNIRDIMSILNRYGVTDPADFEKEARQKGYVIADNPDGCIYDIGRTDYMFYYANKIAMPGITNTVLRSVLEYTYDHAKLSRPLPGWVCDTEAKYCARMRCNTSETLWK